MELLTVDISTPNPAGWQTCAEYTPQGGEIFILRQVRVVALGAMTQSVSKSFALDGWRVLVNGAIVRGFDGACINPAAGVETIDCFVRVGSNQKIELQHNFLNGVGSDVPMECIVLCRMYGQTLLTQNVTLPWEGTNIE